MTVTATVFISRPQEDAEYLAAQLTDYDPTVRCIISPAIDILPVRPPQITGSYDAVILTSRHAVDAAAHVAPDLQAICVGDATALRAKELGLNARSAGGASEDVIALVKQNGIRRALYLHGEHTRGRITDRLQNAGIETTNHVVYTQAERAISASTLADLESSAQIIVPVYSPRSAQIVSHNLAAFSERILLIAISNAAAKAWAPPHPAQIAVASTPTAPSMLHAITSQMHRTA